MRDIDRAQATAIFNPVYSWVAIPGSRNLNRMYRLAGHMKQRLEVGI